MSRFSGNFVALQLDDYKKIPPAKSLLSVGGISVDFKV
jgi:hypothetical protein